MTARQRLGKWGKRNYTDGDISFKLSYFISLRLLGNHIL